MNHLTHRLPKLSALLLALGLLLSLCGCGSSGTAAKDYQAAEALLQQGDYEGAASAFQALGSYEDASRLLMYSRAVLAAQRGDYDTALTAFEALAGFRDSANLKAYCEACLLEQSGASLEAAECFLQIPDTLDASAHADAARETVYQQALSLAAEGDQEASATLLSLLGSYRDAEALRMDMVRQLIHTRLQAGDYDGALFALDLSPEAVSLQPVSESDRGPMEQFLDDFVNAYLYFSANTNESAYPGYLGVQPYVEPGGALDSRFRQVLMIGNFSHNSNFTYYGSTLLDLKQLEEHYYLAWLKATATVSQPAGPMEITRTFRILLHDTDTGLFAGAIGDVLFDEPNPTGRPLVTGPLPEGKLPPDEDGDGVILVDVRKKGFQGTMIIVLDPSRIFVGFPGFYGGNGMILEDLVRRYDALGGINAGGFIDEDGGGSGGLPEGLTIVEGQSYYWAGSGASAAFDENNVLHVGFYTVEGAAEAGIRDCASFGPALITDGAGEYGDHMESGINPRTAIGQRPDGAVLLLCIDGRQLRSMGASYGDLRDVMLDFGAVNACSLDGGSSTVMYYDGQYINSPSSASGTSRYLPNAFLIKK